MAKLKLLNTVVTMAEIVRNTVKHAYEVTSIKQSPVLKGQIFLLLS